MHHLHFTPEAKPIVHSFRNIGRTFSRALRSKHCADELALLSVCLSVMCVSCVSVETTECSYHLVDQGPGSTECSGSLFIPPGRSGTWVY